MAIRLFSECLLLQAEPNLIHFLFFSFAFDFCAAAAVVVAATSKSVGLNQNGMRDEEEEEKTNHTINDSCFLSTKVELVKKQHFLSF